MRRVRRWKKLTEKERDWAKLSGYREMAGLSDRYHFKAIVWIVPLDRWEDRLFDDPDVKDLAAAAVHSRPPPSSRPTRGSPLLSRLSCLARLWPFPPRSVRSTPGPGGLEASGGGARHELTVAANLQVMAREMLRRNRGDGLHPPDGRRPCARLLPRRRRACRESPRRHGR